jgi:hypothetical protein
MLQHDQNLLEECLLPCLLNLPVMEGSSLANRMRDETFLHAGSDARAEQHSRLLMNGRSGCGAFAQAFARRVLKAAPQKEIARACECPGDQESPR